MIKRIHVIGACVAIGIVGAWQGASAIQNAVQPIAPDTKRAPKPTPKLVPPLAEPKAPLALAATSKATPMAERVATIGLLNKRNGLSRDFVMKPGEAVRVGDVVIRLKACETTAPWEVEKLTGAFVQVIVHGSDDKWRRAFSGWLFKESPSLNVVENPIYDVWTKDCAMRHPDTGPDTVVVRGGEAPKAKKSGAQRSADDSDAI
jgi:hypothetical protein